MWIKKLWFHDMGHFLGVRIGGQVFSKASKGQSPVSSLPTAVLTRSSSWLPGSASVVTAYRFSLRAIAPDGKNRCGAEG